MWGLIGKLQKKTITSKRITASRQGLIEKLVFNFKMFNLKRQIDNFVIWSLN